MTSDDNVRHIRIRKDDPAEAYRIRQVEKLLRENGFKEQPDGTWVPGDDAEVTPEP